MNGNFAVDPIQSEASSGRLALIVSHDGQVFATVPEFTGSALRRQREDHRRPNDRLVVLVFDADDRVVRNPLAGIIDGALSFHYHDIQYGRGSLRIQDRKSD